MVDTKYILAVDIGQSKDYTALVIVKSTKTERKVGPWPSDPIETTRRHDVVHIERFRDVPYPAQVARIAERHNELKRIASEDRSASVRTVVDATGVGKPILDALREAGVAATGVVITGGDAKSRSGGVLRVPKRELVSSLQIALQAKRLRIAPELPLAEMLVKEFQGFKVKISLAGHARFGNDVGAWREAEHDDLVLATSLATWTLESDKRASLQGLRRAAGLRPSRQ